MEGCAVPQRWRWLAWLAAAGAFAAGFVAALGALVPAPPGPEPAAPIAETLPAEPVCSEADLADRFVGVYAGEVAIYAGNPGGCSRLVETTGIPVEQLSTFQRLDVERGIAFSGDDELFQILEGLTAP
nr:hypothetical protein [Bacillota bacterium]